MTINSHLSKFFGLDIADYDPSRGIQSPENTAYKIALSWDDSEAGKTAEELLEHFLANANATQVRALIVGSWGETYDSSPQKLIDLLIDKRDRLPNLRAIFFGDIVMEECEISWIIQGRYQKFFPAFPQLEHFQVRGSTDLDIGVIAHENLRALVVECGGLPKKIIQEITQSNLSALNHLELWLGSDNYGYDATKEDLEKLINTPFPKLSYLGLRDSEEADIVAEILANAPVLKQINTLDLSLGNLSDRGAQSLLNSPFIALLDILDLHYHYVSDELQQRLRQLGITVDLSDPQEEDRDSDGDVYRYIAVSE